MPEDDSELETSVKSSAEESCFISKVQQQHSLELFTLLQNHWAKPFWRQIFFDPNAIHQNTVVSYDFDNGALPTLFTFTLKYQKVSTATSKTQIPKAD